jgi:Xaa-Pro aminopeptidase
MPADGRPMLFVRRYYPRARRESPIESIVPVETVKAVPGLIREAFGGLPEVLGFELDVMPVREFRFWRKLLAVRSAVDASPHILNCRMVKSPWEIERMMQTADMSARTFDYMRRTISPGITEMAFAADFERFARDLGHGGRLRVRDYQSEGYPWHVLAGPSGGMAGLLDAPASGEGTSAAFPCGAGFRRFCAGEPIMVDFGSVLNGYHMDETRMFAIDAMPPEAAAACRAAIEIHDRILALARPGVPVDTLYRQALSAAEKLGLGEAFLGPPGYKVNFVGHGIGLELVEPPFIAKNRTDRLRTGMTIALEPKFVYEKKFSAGIESVCQVTDDGARLISKTPMEIFVC